MIGDNCHVVMVLGAIDKIGVTFNMEWKLSSGKG
jgi:hypothetical protein